MKTKSTKPPQVYKVSMVFDMSWGVRSRCVVLTRRTTKPKRLLSNVRLFGYYTHGHYVPASRLIEARIEKVVA